LFAEVRLLRGNTRTVMVWGPIFGIGFLCLLLSLTRSAWIGCGFGSVLVVGWIVRRGGLSKSRALALTAAVIVGMAVAYAPVRDRLDENHSKAAEERWKLNFVNLEMMKAHPIFGIGLNTAYDVKTSYIPSFFTDDDWVYIAHNQFLLVGAETGLVGLAAFVWVLWLAIKAAYVGSRARDPLVGETGMVLLAFLLAMTWGMNLDFYGGMQVYVLLWFIMGCAAGVQVLVEREKLQSAPAAVVATAA
jgi:O-antigen ligase